MDISRQNRGRAPQSTSSDEAERLRRTVRDLAALSALPSIWVVGDLAYSLQNLTDVLCTALRAFTVCLRMKLPDGSSFETSAAVGIGKTTRPKQQIIELLDAVQPNANELIEVLTFNGNGPLNALAQPIFFENREVGYFVGCYREEMVPGEHDRLLLQVAATQVTLLLQRHKDQDERLARQRAEDQLRQTEHHYQQLVQSLAAAVYTCDNDGRITLFNEAAVALWGRRPKLGEDRWCGSWKIFKPDGTPMAAEDCPMAVAIREGRSVRGQEIIVEKPDGSRAWVLPHPDPIRDESGRIVGTVNMLVDIGPLKSAEHTARTSEAKMKSLLTLMPAAVYACNADGQITFYNRRAAELWGCEPALNDAQDKFCAAFRCWFGDKVLAPDETPMAIAVREGKAFRDLEPVFERPDGKRISVLVNIDPFFDTNGKPAGAINVFQDVTLLKHAQAELRARQEHLQAIVDNTPECVKLVAADGTLLAMNDTGLCMVEADSIDQLLGKNIYDVITPEFRDAFRAMNERVCAGQKERLEFQITGLKGTPRWVETHAAPIVDPVTGQRVQLAVTRDVTERRRTEEALRQSEERLRNIFNQTTAGIAQVDLEGRFLMVNQRFCEITGYSADDLQTRTCAGITHPEDHSCNHAMFERARHDRQPYIIEKRYIRPDGSEVWVRNNVSEIRDAEGKPEYMLAVCIDITEQKRIESELHRRTQELTAFFETAAIALHWIGPDGRIIWANAAEMQMLGYSAEEYIGHHIAEFHADQMAIENILSRLTRGEKLCDHEARLKCKDGSIKHVLIDSSVLWEDGKFLHTQCFTRDVTEKKRADEALRNNESRLRQLVEALPAAIYTTDAQGRITLFNQAAVEFSGRVPELGTDSWCVSWKLYWPDGTPLPHDQCPMALALKEARPIRGYEAIAERPDGTRVNFIPFPTPLFDHDGKLIGAINMLVDITQRKRMEEALAEGARRQEALFKFVERRHRATSVAEMHEAALDAIQSSFGCDRAAVLLFDDSKVMRFACWRGLSQGYRDAVEGHSPWKSDDARPGPVCIPDIEEAEIPETLKAIVRAEGIRALAFIPLLIDGRLAGKFMTYYNTPHEFNNGELELSLTIALQLALGIERKRAEDSLRASEERISQLLSLMPAAVYTCDADGRITFFNRRAAELWGREPALNDSDEKFCGSFRLRTTDGSNLPHDETPMVHAIKNGSSTRNREVVIERPDGSQVIVSVNIDPLFDRNGNRCGAINVFQDISERKEMEDALRQSQREEQSRRLELETIMETAPAIVWIAHDPECRKITGNRVGYEFLRVPPGGNLSRTAPPEQRPSHFEVFKNGERIPDEDLPIQKAARTGEPIRGEEIEHRFSDGTSQWLYGNIVPLLDQNQCVRGVLATFVDITERKRVEQRLSIQYSISRVLVGAQSIAEAAPAILETVCMHTGWDCGGLWLRDNKSEELRCLEVWSRASLNVPEFAAASRSQAFQKGFGLPGQVWAEGKSLWFSNFSRNANFPRAPIAAKEGLRAAMAFPVHAGGEFIGVLEFFSRNLREPDADFLEMLGSIGSQIGQLIERKRAEEALRASEERYRSLVSVITDVPWSTDVTGAFVTPQPAWADYTGQSWEQYRGFGWANALHPDDRERIQTVWRHACETGSSYRVEGRVWHAASGNYRHFAARATPLFNPDGGVREWVGTCTDIDDQKRSAEVLEQTVKERTAKLRETVAELEAFSYSIAHDMRAPLRALQSFSRLLEEDCAEQVTDDGRDYLRRITTSAARMDRLIQDVLTYSRVARSEITLVPIDLDPFVRGIIESYPQLQPPHVCIEVSGPLPLVMGNEASLTQCISNLLGNAVKFVQRGVRPNILVRGEKRASRSRIWIEDNGIGIPPDQHQRIFEIFQRAHKGYDGTGIGLAIVKKAVERMGGTVGLESQPGKGSKFWLELASPTNL